MSNFDFKKEIRLLIQKKANSFCADCYDSCALFVDINNSVFLCRECSEIHKNFGFIVKNATNDIFTIEEIDKLKQSDNDTFNKKWMSLYSSQSIKIPFGASNHERQVFLYEKYISKRWFSSTQNSKNISFYKPHHLEIQETNLDDLDELIFYDSSSSSSLLSEQTDQSDLALFNIGQKELEIIDNESTTIYQVKNQMSSSDRESENSNDEFEMMSFNQESVEKKSRKGSQDKQTEREDKIRSEKVLAKQKEEKGEKSKRKKKMENSEQKMMKEEEEKVITPSYLMRKSFVDSTSHGNHCRQKMRTSLKSSSNQKKCSKIVNVKRKLVVLVISNVIAFDIVRPKKSFKNVH